MPTRKAVIRKTDANERWRGCEEIGTLPHYWGDGKYAAALALSSAVTQSVRQQSYHLTQQFHA